MEPRSGVGATGSDPCVRTDDAHAADGSLAKFGVETAGVKLNLNAMLDEKLVAVKGLTDGIAFLFKKNKVEWLKGRGRIAGPGQVGILPDLL